MIPGASSRLAESISQDLGESENWLSTGQVDGQLPTLSPESISVNAAASDSDCKGDLQPSTTLDDQAAHCLAVPASASETPTDSLSSDQPDCSFLDFTADDFAAEMGPGIVAFDACGTTHQASSSHGATNLLDWSQLQDSTFDSQLSTWDMIGSGLTTAEPPVSPQHLWPNPRTKKRKRTTGRQPNVLSGYFSATDSFSSAESNLGIVSNNTLITSSLLRIYNDVLENNMSCWLAEETCPYKMGEMGMTLGNRTAPHTRRFSASESNWQNRILHRVIQLDRFAQSTKLIHLTASENFAVSRTLNLAIMAFSMQWAQGKRRHARHSWEASNPFEGQAVDLEDEFADAFEQTLQQTIWEQANRALKDISHIESYRAIFAQLVFGLTHKPWCSKDFSSTSNFGGYGSYAEETPGATPSILAELKELISQEGPPLVLESAARKIHILKSRFEAYEVGYGRRSCNNEASSGVPATDVIENRRTIGLLYWLAVMFDTVSSGMNGRPNALCDEDCQNDAIRMQQRAEMASAAERQGLNYQWKLDYFARDVAEPNVLRWPCTYDAAADAVIRSAPVKILLYRHISYLQSAVRRQAPHHQVEDLIQAAIRTYRHWNTTFGAFFKELVNKYDSVPPRIKGWFTCIYIPWLLGALLLVDLIDFVDKKGLGLEDGQTARRSSNLASAIRKASAVELSDIARVTKSPTAKGGPSWQHLPDLHFAVNEGATLIEPWSMILIRAFTKAAVFHLDAVIAESKQEEWFVLGHQSDELRDSTTHCQNCIEALWFIGRKSQLSRNLAQVLSRAFRSACYGRFQSRPNAEI